LGEPFFRKIRAREDKKVSRRSTDRVACHRSKIKDLHLETAFTVLHLEAGPNPLEADCMKFQPFWVEAGLNYTL
jgi:hypothetical protein